MNILLDNGYPPENDAKCICESCNQDVDSCECPGEEGIPYHALKDIAMKYNCWLKIHNRTATMVYPDGWTVRYQKFNNLWYELEK